MLASSASSAPPVPPHALLLQPLLLQADAAHAAGETAAGVGDIRSGSTKLDIAAEGQQLGDV